MNKHKSNNKISTNLKDPQFSSWKNCQLFSGLSDEQLNNLSSHLISKTYAEGDILIKEGSYGDAIFFIEKGSAAILKGDIKIAENFAGEYFGAMALMENTSRSADVKATSPLEVKVLTINQLKAIESDTIFIRILTNHLKKQQELIRSKNEVIINSNKSKLKAAESRLEKIQLYYYSIILLSIIILGLLAFIIFR